MTRRTWINRLFAPRPFAARKSADRQRRLAVEKLEERTVPTFLDLTGGIGLSGTINDAIFTSVDPQPMGTGFIDPFVRIQRNPSNPSGAEAGYNTDGQEEFETKDAGGHNWTHSLKLSNLQEDENGYYTFTLDVNETKPGALISLDELQLFVQNKGNLTGAVLNADGKITHWKNGALAANCVYDMDAAPAGDSSVLLNYFLNHGSGSGDMTVKIHKSVFTGGQYVYLYSKFGADIAGAGAEAGFEEWTAAVRRDAGEPSRFGLSGHKFKDVNGDFDITGDPIIEGWRVDLYRETNGVAGFQIGSDTHVETDLTDSNGEFFFADLLAGTYYTVEEHRSGWVQTYGGNDGNDFYTTTLNGPVTDLDFANFELFDICGEKYRDIDRDGEQDGNEPLLSGWTIFLDGSNGGTVNGQLDQGEISTVTGPDGAYCFTDLGPGTYIVLEVLKPNWQQTSVNPPPISGISGVNVGNVDFGNVLVNPGIGHTKGYWHNQNGHATIDAMGGWDVIKLELANLYLRNEDGTLFFASNPSQADFDALLTNESDASNAVSQLSAQIAAAYLNMRAGEAGLTDPEGNPFAIGDTLLEVSTAISPNGYITVSDLVAEGRRILHGNNLIGPPLSDYDLIDPSPERDYALLVMGALDGFNNSINIVNA